VSRANARDRFLRVELMGWIVVGLQGQTSAAVINEMRDSLIDHYA